MQRPLAKLTPPRLTRVIRRERLHQALEGAARAPVVWFGAAAGTGKTTAAASYLASRKGPVRWYRVDAGDLDLAAFFHYLSLAAANGRVRRMLPIFGPEYGDQPVAFARRYFREFYARLPEATTLVFDDLHMAAATLLPAIVAVAIEELPAGFQLFLLSREQVPAMFAGFRVTDRLAIVDDSLLRFDAGEAAALIRGRLGDGVDDATQARVQSRARGWAAGLVLLSEQATHAAAKDAPDEDEPGQILFDYFAREVFERMDAADRRFMQLTALLPDFTAQAANAVACRADAQKVLDDLHRRQLFLTRMADRVPRYQYHDLFRAFLLDRLGTDFAAATLRAARLRAADAALADERIDLAIELCIAAGAPERAAELLCAHAPTLLRQGRRETLRTWVQQLPASVADARPWLHYWQGVASMIDDEALATVHLERAHAGFIAVGDAAAACLTAAQAILAIHMSWDTHSGASLWIGRLTASAAASASLAPGDRMRVATACLRAASMDETYRVDDEAVATDVATVLAMLEERANGIDANARLVAADALQERALSTSAQALFERAVEAVTPWLSDPAVTAWARCHWLISFGLVSGRRYPYPRTGFPYASADEALQEAWDTSQREELPDLRFAATLAMINVARAVGADDRTEALVARLGAECNASHPIQVCNQMNQQAAQLSRRGRYAEALQAEESALAAAARARLQLGEQWNEWLTKAQILIGLGRCDEAADLMRAHEPSFTGVFARVMRIVAASAETWDARSAGAPDYVDRLRACMADVRAMGWVNYMTIAPLVVAALWADALAQGIERDFIVAAIRRRGISAPAPDTPAWPWPLRVRILGAIAIERDDVPVRLGAKVPLKPLELLKVLAASPQHRLDAQQAECWLWPDADSAAAKAALDVALHRLRKLLGSDAAVTLAGGKLQIAAKHVWVDASAFESWLDEARRQMDAAPQSRAAAALAERLFVDYRGRLFGDDAPTAWSIGPRERLHGKFLQLVGALGRFYEVRSEWHDARRIYERGLAQDELAEEFHRGLIRCALSLDEPAVALHAYRRCREILSVVLGVAPAAATRSLITAIPGPGSEG